MLPQLLDDLDLIRHLIGHYGSLATLWYWAQPADLQVVLYAALLLAGAVVARLLCWARARRQ